MSDAYRNVYDAVCDAFDQYQQEGSDAAKAEAESGAIANDCDMCSCYDRPGFVVNANQWVPCWQCNPRTNRDGTPERTFQT